MNKLKSESSLSFLEATSIIVGHGVGAGILSVPYLAAHNSLREILLIIAFCYLFNILLHLLIAELSLNNGGAQFVSCFESELFAGKLKTVLTWTAFALLGVSVIVNVSAFLTGAAAVFRSWFGLPDWAGILIFYVLGAGVGDGAGLPPQRRTTVLRRQRGADERVPLQQYRAELLTLELFHRHKDAQHGAAAPRGVGSGKVRRLRQERRILLRQRERLTEAAAGIARGGEKVLPIRLRQPLFQRVQQHRLRQGGQAQLDTAAADGRQQPVGVLAQQEEHTVGRRFLDAL